MMMLTPEDMAERIKRRQDRSYAEMADEIGVSKSAVGNALAQPSTRRKKVLASLLEMQGDRVRLDAHYPVK